VLTVIIAVVAAVVLYWVGRVPMDSLGWAITLGTVGLLGTMVPINYWLKKRLEAVFKEAQDTIEKSQNAVKRQMNQMQNRMTGGDKGLQKQLEKKQTDGIRQALEVVEKARPLFKWNPLARRQTNTLKAQLYYQIKEFEKADECFRKCLILDPITYAMRMARAHAVGDKARVEKMYRKGIKRYKDAKGVLIYALYSWILVREKKLDEAVQVLEKGKDATESEILRDNWTHLVNDRARRFSNAGLGESWYALQLETPKPIRMKARGNRRFM
jgi:tetratricopeptide (TPR) repeat protein